MSILNKNKTTYRYKEVNNMSILGKSQDTLITIFVILFVAIFLVAIILILYKFVFTRVSAKKQIKIIERTYSYLDALLCGQDAQYIQRLSILATSNLTYIPVYENFRKQFNDIREIEDKYAEAKIKQVKSLIANKQFKNIKDVIIETKKAVEIFEASVNKLDRELYQIIKPEEESRQTILKLKEEYRTVKQTFYVGQADLTLVNDSFMKIFDKLDKKFEEFEVLIDSANYAEANSLMDTITKVVHELKEVLAHIPNLCILLETIIPSKIEEINTHYSQLEAEGYPLFHLSFRSLKDGWFNKIEKLKSDLVSLRIQGVNEKCDEIIAEINNVEAKLNKEIEDKHYFEENHQVIYKGVIDLEKSFLKICSILPEITKVYRVEESQTILLQTLKANVDKLGISKRNLDVYIHSATKQPFCVLKEKLELLKNDYEIAKDGLENFKAYIDSLKVSAEEAYNMVFAYTFRLKNCEQLLRSILIDEVVEQYKAPIDACYELLNDIYQTIIVKPIDVVLVNQKVSELETIANPLFDEIDSRHRQCQLAESAIVFANRDRNHQTDVSQQLDILDEQFFAGDFENVYHAATSIFHRSHVEEGTNE